MSTFYQCNGACTLFDIACVGGGGFGRDTATGAGVLVFCGVGASSCTPLEARTAVTRAAPGDGALETMGFGSVT